MSDTRVPIQPLRREAHVLSTHLECVRQSNQLHGTHLLLQTFLHRRQHVLSVCNDDRHNGDTVL
ncbi:hypothetical protein X801_10412 [Opisthorchis viverrini]|uniref:Uncharacterized protein n=2 Tax=Opisthorchis viverrini TaxID=6198 RepID=A0A1S8WH75_OPIVI|nr:hypothetical protein T265_07825 [Opisthorchis viverrini]KER24508.1 hypothetical protein T265_07825 [Opisthorchis viverrini]OON13805.1 hypothetical protein X801_10412 [Opisthorchis viverrini]